MERKTWLEDSIEEHIKNNPKKDSVDIVSHFKLRADITLSSLNELVNERRVTRLHLYGANYGYVVSLKQQEC